MLVSTHMLYLLPAINILYTWQITQRYQLNDSMHLIGASYSVTLQIKVLKKQADHCVNFANNSHLLIEYFLHWGT